MNINNLNSNKLRLVSNWEKSYDFDTFDTVNWTEKQFNGTITQTTFEGDSAIKLTTTGSGNFGDPQNGCVGFQSAFDLPNGDFEVEIRIFPITNFSMHWDIPDVTAMDSYGRPIYTNGRSVDFGQSQGMLFEKISGNNQIKKYIGASISETPTSSSVVRVSEVGNRVTVKVDGQVDTVFTMNPSSNSGRKLFISNGSTNFFGFGNYSTIGQELDILHVNIRSI